MFITAAKSKLYLINKKRKEEFLEPDSENSCAHYRRFCVRKMLTRTFEKTALN